MPLVSISINQTVPLRDALFELAKQANYDIELDPKIVGSIIFVAREQPLDVVIHRIADIAGLRYKFDGPVLRIQVDTPYHENYKVDYLSFIRKNSSKVENNVSLAQTGGGGSGGAETGSEFQAQGDNTADFWGELNTNLQQILGVPADAGEMRTTSDPQISVVSNSNNTAPVQPVVAPGPDGKTAAVQPPQATLQVSSLPPASGAAARATAPAGGSSTPSFSLNKQAGIVSVFATERQHKQIREYLKQLRRSSTAQVLIEAKVMEVNLSDEFASGVNWSSVARLLGGNIRIHLGTWPEPTLDPVAGGVFGVGRFRNGEAEEDIMTALSRFGTVKALASPRVTVVNNQSAVLDVALNKVYFSVTATVTPGTATTAGTTNVTSTAHSVPEGVLINVQPSIDLERQTINLSVRPTVTRIVDKVPDPGVALLNIPNVASLVPEVNIQELDSVIQMQNGEVALMGGLMQDRTEGHQTGTPVLSEIPVVGGAFRNQSDRILKTELVILLKATILNDGDQGQDDTDRDIYKTFSDDRHPFNL
jgi:general secretion pathway protein D